MLSLGYPKVNFQLANEIAHQQLLQYIREKLQQVSDPGPSIERPVKVEESQQKNNAFRVGIRIYFFVEGTLINTVHLELKFI